MPQRLKPIDPLTTVSAVLAQQGQTLSRIAAIARQAANTPRFKRERAQIAAALLIDATRDLSLLAEQLESMRRFVELYPGVRTTFAEAQLEFDAFTASARVHIEHEALVRSLSKEMPQAAAESEGFDEEAKQVAARRAAISRKQPARSTSPRARAV